MIFCILGRGASGKDTLMDLLMQIYDLERLPLFTTRPQRPTEKDDAYIWGYKLDDGIYADFQNRLIKIDDNCVELRKYNTMHGEWYYGTLAPSITTLLGESIDIYNIKENNYIVVTAPQQLKNYVDLYGKDNISLIYIDCPKEVCEERIMRRDCLDKEEASRRLESDDKDYSELEIDKIRKLELNTFSFPHDSETRPIDILASLSISGFLDSLDLKTSY